jgi:hypothetical protein
VNAHALIAVLALVATSATAQQPFDEDKFIGETFEAAYSLWGVMRVVETECTALTGGDPAYAKAIGDWRIANQPARAEIDTAYAASGLTLATPSESELVGEELMRQQLTISANQQVACDTFLRHVIAGDYDAHKAMSYQVAIFRDSGLLPKDPPQ